MVRKVMLVEDDARVRAALSHALLAEGLTLLSCKDAEQAMDTMKRTATDGAPDVAILDLRLPGTWGDELGRRLHAQHPSTRIIFVTGEINVTDRLHLLVPGCEVMSKPVDPKKLMRMVM